MLVDGRSLAGGEEIQTDICIVGSGPAGMTLARELMGQRFQVCLLESGGLEFDEEIQALYRGEVAGLDIRPLETMRVRQLGGTPNHWPVDMVDGRLGARFVPLDETDFEAREWIAYSGWPITRCDLDPYYARAHATCGLGPYAYEPDSWRTPQSPGPLFNGPRIQSSVFQFGPRDVFTQQYPQEVAQAPNVQTFVHANVLEIETEEDGESVRRLSVACLDGKKFWVSARLFVLAAGGIENARLLLASSGTEPAGVGNRHDLVGRFFMDHPAVSLGLLVPSRPELIDAAAFYDLKRRNGVLTMGYLAFGPEVLREERLQGLCMHLHPRPRWYGSAALAFARVLLSIARQRRPSRQFWPRLRGVLLDPASVFELVRGRLVGPKLLFLPSDRRGGWSDVDNGARIWHSLEVVASSIEQAPDPENRVMLSSEQDAFGKPKARLVWRWSEKDAASVKRARDLLADEIERLGLGRLQPVDLGDTPLLRSTSAGHHIGTTRMHRDAKQGVVDENCRVHGVSNLFVAGSSVFPTGGYANPTLTVVALAHRLADHVRELMAPGNTGRTDRGANTAAS